MSVIRQDTSKGDTARVAPTSLNIMRDIKRLDSVAVVGRGDIAMIGYQKWTYRELIDYIGDTVAFVLGLHGVSTRTFSTRDARVLMAASGASTFTIERHGRAIAASVRTHAFKHTSWSAR